ncbi:MAG: AMP-binding protein [Duodenibacillus sp.]|nr:AMP-binding protein [Duodenibacillus sp.]
MGGYTKMVERMFDGIEVRTGDNDELQVRGPTVMNGYWKRPEDTAAMFTEDGWLKTGDQGDIQSDGYIRIKGRIKEIIVTSTGEKISPVDLEFAIQEDPLFDQVMAVGENRPYVACLAVLNKQRWAALCKDLQRDPADPATMGLREVRTAVLKRVRSATKDFPRYGQPRNVCILPEPWTVDNGLLTTTMKLRRRQIAERFQDEIEELFTGHGA